MSDHYIYKILRPAEWETLQTQGVFLGSLDDIKDGFIHFSSANQVQGTLDKHFKDEPHIVIARIDTTHLGHALRWEVSRGGAAFPHLYAPLSKDSITAHIRLDQIRLDQIRLEEPAQNHYQIPKSFLVET